MSTPCHRFISSPDECSPKELPRPQSRTQTRQRVLITLPGVLDNPAHPNVEAPPKGSSHLERTKKNSRDAFRKDSAPGAQIKIEPMARMGKELSHMKSKLIAACMAVAAFAAIALPATASASPVLTEAGAPVAVGSAITGLNEGNT